MERDICGFSQPPDYLWGSFTKCEPRRPVLCLHEEDAVDYLTDSMEGLDKPKSAITKFATVTSIGICINYMQ